MQKKQLFIFIAAVLLVLIISLSIVLFGDKEEEAESINQIPRASITTNIIPVPSVFIPEALEQEKIDQETYGKARQEYLQERPWVLKMPIKGSNYFISYDSEKDEFRIAIYYSPSSSIPKEDQLNLARNEALKAIGSLGPEASGVNIVYIETIRNN